MQPRSRFSILLTMAVAGGIAIAAAISPWQGSTDVRYLRVWEYVMLAVFVLGMAYAIVRRHSLREAWDVICMVAAVVGVWFLSALVLPMWIAILVSSVLTLIVAFLDPARSFFLLVGSVGIAFAFARWMPIEVLLVGLAALTLYDMVFGQKTDDTRQTMWILGPLAVMLGMLPFGWIAFCGVFGGGLVGAVASSVRPSSAGREWPAIGAVCSAVFFLVFYVIV
jgi:hypothetical protein